MDLVIEPLHRPETFRSKNPGGYLGRDEAEYVSTW